MSREPLLVAVNPIRPKAFKPYGDLLERPAVGSRQDFAAMVENRRAGARANLTLIRVEPFSFKAPITVLERHPHSTQFFAPLDVTAYLVIVTDDQAGRPDLAKLKAFQVEGRQAISYHAGVWHANMATIGAPGSFCMLIHEDGSPGDCEYVKVAPFLPILPGRASA